MTVTATRVGVLRARPPRIATCTRCGMEWQVNVNRPRHDLCRDCRDVLA